jgi:lipoprotein-releasing system permease protein
MRFESQLAFRHLKTGGGQTLLTVGAVALAVTVIVFITSIIRGVQQRFFVDLIGSIAHIVVRPPEPEPQTLAEALGQPRDGKLYASRRENQAQQRKDIENAAQLATQIARFPGVRAAAPAVRGQAFLIRGEKRFGLSVSGADPSQQNIISNLQENMIAGDWLSIQPDQVVIGRKLAEKSKLGLGDRVRLQSADGITQVFRIAGLFETGLDTTDEGAAFMTLRAAQGLFAMPQKVSVIQVKLDDPFKANDVADMISAALPFQTDSWMREQAQIMDGLRTQNMVTYLISIFSLAASTLSIAAVLIVSVLQKQKQIGILKSMGARDRQILVVFTLEGIGIAVMGALLGAALSYGLLSYMMSLKREVRFGKTNSLLPIELDPMIFGAAMLAAIVATLFASLLPAQRAAKLNPVDVIRAG